LPFEGQSLDANTEWSFQLPQENQPFDYDTISDLVLHIQYTAEAETHASSPGSPEPPEPSERSYYQAISVRHDFPAVSRQLSEGIATEATVELDDRLFPYFARECTTQLFYRVAEDGTLPEGGIPLPGNLKFGPLPSITLVGPDDADAFLVVEYTL